jgi:hypothetical protein
LKKLSVGGMLITQDLMQYFLQELKYLKNLDFHYVYFVDYVDESWTSKKNLMIEKIAFRNDKQFGNLYLVPTIIALFELDLLPNLKVASFWDFPDDLLTEVLLVIQTTAEELEEVQFCRCEIPALELKQVKRAKFVESQEKFIYEFLSVNVHVEGDIKSVIRNNCVYKYSSKLATHQI